MRYLYSICAVLFLTCGLAVSQAAVLYQDSFDDGDYTTAEGADGLTWTVVRGTADASNSNLKLADGGLAVTDQVISADSVTVIFRATSSWSRSLSFVFLYKDSSNYYYTGLSGNNKGVYRIMDGDTTRLYSDAGGLIAIPHASGATRSFKFFITNTGGTMEIKIDKSGDGADYDVAVTDDDPAAVTLFTGGAIGAELNGPFDNFEIHDELVRTSYTGSVYYVDVSAGNDTRTKAQAQDKATPWQSIAAAEDSAQAGDTIVVAAGTYHEGVGIGQSGSVFDALVIRGASAADKPVLDGEDTLSTAFSVGGYKHHIILENFEVTNYTGHGFTMGRGSERVLVKDCHIHHNGGKGVYARWSKNLTVQGCLINDNYDSGIAFSTARGFTVRNCEITMNLGEAGIWIGGGTSQYFDSYDVLVEDCYIHHQPPVIHHADNFQMHQVQGIVLQNNVFIQTGEQNMWCQYTDNYRIQNNIFMGGPLGINSSMHNQLYHNVFYNSTLRYDQHQTNHPNHGGYYKPQDVDIVNNLILESSIAWTPDGLIDRFAVFDIDNNYFNIQNSWSRQSWTFGGYRMDVKGGGRAVTDQTFTGSTANMSYRASLSWSTDGRFIIMYKDTLNYYAFAMAGNAGLYRILDGTETKVSDVTAVKLPHASGATAAFTVGVSLGSGSVGFDITKTTGTDTSSMTITDDNAAAASLFGTGYAVGFSYNGKFTGAYDDLRVTAGGITRYDGFTDRDLLNAEGDTGLTWTVVNDTVRVIATGGSGIGIGDNSRMDTDHDSLAGIIGELPADTFFTSYDFRPPEGSWLIDRARTIPGIDKDKDGQDRVMGGIPDIGPYEFFTTGIRRVPDGQAPQLPMIIKYQNPARTRIVLTVEGAGDHIVISDVTGRTAAVLEVKEGRAVLHPAAHGMNDGLYILQSTAGDAAGKLILTK